jgi:hypothetical protein
MLLGKTLEQIDRCNHLTSRAGYTSAIVIFSIVTFSAQDQLADHQITSITLGKGSTCAPSMDGPYP